MPDFTPELLDTVTAEMKGDGVWIDPAFATEHRVTAAQERELEQAVADTVGGDVPVRVVLTDVPSDSVFNGRPERLGAWIADDLDTDYVWVLADPAYEPLVTVHSTLEDSWSYYEVPLLAEREHPGDVVAQALEAVGLSQLDSHERFEMEQASRPEETAPRTEDEGGSGALWAIGALVLAGVAVLVAGRAGWRRWRANRTGFQLSAAVVEQVLEAEERSIRARAEQETDALGEALASDLDLSGPVGLAALDNHAAARKVLEHDPGLPDLMGALVLARRGRAALAHLTLAPKGSAWEAPVPCWVNPGHDWAEPPARRGQGAGSGPQHPLCKACGRAGHEPDLFRVRKGRTTVAWYRAELGVWTRTGYGTRAPDSTTGDLATEVLAQR